MIFDKVFGTAAMLPVAADSWDVGTFLENATKTIKEWGNLLLILLGAVMLIWAGVLLFKKLTATPQTEGQQAGWGKIALLILVGGALMAVGFTIMSQLGSGGKDSIIDLGNGSGTILMLDTYAQGLFLGR